MGKHQERLSHNELHNDVGLAGNGGSNGTAWECSRPFSRAYSMTFISLALVLLVLNKLGPHTLVLPAGLLLSPNPSSWLWWPSFVPTAVRLHADGPVCRNPVSFPTTSPTSVPLTMALAAETKHVVSQFEFSGQDVDRSVKEFLRQMNAGLHSDGTSISQIPTYVTGVPNGTEKGLFLAVDLGGTNFRVCSVQLNGDTTFNMTHSKVAVPKDLMVAGTARELFAFLARQIEDFLKKHHTDEYNNSKYAVGRRRPALLRPDTKVFNLGFTFSFPVQQLAIDKGLLIRWTKGFDIPDAVGKDVCALLQAELDRLGLPVRVAALVNDTVGTLMARSYTAHGDQKSLLGAIFGTGTNGAYLEKLHNIKKPVAGDYDTAAGEMIVNTEWGSFDNQLNVLPSTPWDRALDAGSVNPGIQMFEKRVSGMFLGEVVRLAVVDMIADGKTTLFRGANASRPAVAPDSPLRTPWALDTAVLSVAAADDSPELSTLRRELEAALGVPRPSLEDAQAFKAVANAVGRRAARLSAVAIAATVLQSGQLRDPAVDVVDVGVDGSLVEHYPYFRDMIYDALRSVDGIGPKGADCIRIGIAKDGSGVGAALIALVASRAAARRPHLSDDVKRNLDRIQPGPELTPLNIAVIAGVLGAITLGALWFARWRR